MSKWADELTDLSDIVNSTVSSGDVRVNLGDSTTNAGVAASVAVFGMDGFVSRPSDADDDGAATAIYLVSGDQKFVIGSRDRRYASKVGNLLPGDRAIVSKGNARFLLKNSRDALTLYTERQSNNPAQRISQLISNDGQTGKITLAVGLTKIEITEDSISLSINGGPSIKLDKLLNNIALMAGALNLDGGSVTLGLMPGGLRPVLPAVQSVLFGPAGTIGQPSTNVLVAP